VVLVEFWLRVVNCLNSRAWLESVARDKPPAGSWSWGPYPELREERSPGNVRQAVARLGIRYPVMWMGITPTGAPCTSYWPAFYLIGRDGLLYGSAIGEMHAGERRPGKWSRDRPAAAGGKRHEQAAGCAPSDGSLPA